MIRLSALLLELFIRKRKIPNTEFTVETTPLVNKLKEAKREDGVEEDIIAMLD